MKLKLHFDIRILFCCFCFLVSTAINAQPKTVPDNSYGKNGTKTTTVNGDFTKEEYKNKDGKLMEVKKITENEDGSIETSNDFYSGELDAKGNPIKLKEKFEKKDAYGTVIDSWEKVYDPATQKITKGNRTVVEPDGTKKKYDWNNSGGKKGKGGWVEIIGAMVKPCNEFYVGINGIHESGGFFTVGPNIIYQHFVTNHVGIMGDAGIYFGSNGGANFTKTQVLAGLGFLPGGNSRVAVEPYIEAGIANVKSKFKGELTTYTSSSTSLSVAAGVRVSMPVNERFSFTAKADYNPTISNGIRSNFRIGAGLSIKLCPKKEKGNTMTDEIPKQPPVVLASLSAYDFDTDPPLYKPGDDPDLPLAKNPLQTKADNCENGEDVFEYYNGASKEVDGTLIIRNNGKCKVHVLVQKITNKPPGGSDKNGGKKEEGNKEDEKNGGKTKEKNPKAGTKTKNDKNGKDDKDDKKEGGNKKNGEEKLETLFDYGVEKMQGSDIYSFKIPKKSWIRVTVFCREGDGPCDFTRSFSVTKNDEIKVADNKIPKLPVDPPKAVDKIEIYNPSGNRCMSKDLVFYRITNRDVKDVMTVYYKAVSECSCYFEAYTDLNPDQPQGEPKPLKGDKLGEDEKNHPAPKEIAKPATNVKLSKGDELVQVVPPGKTIYLKGRCPLQQPAPGPCKGYIEITGISYTKK